MILLGAYPNTFFDRRGQDAISYLNDALCAVAPADTPLHILPFTLSSGDGGFAQDDWFTVSPELGTWDDIRRMAKSRPLMVDIIYNHVGLNHRYAKEFFAGMPEACEYFYTYSATTTALYPNSPRGGPVLNDYNVKGNDIKLWQTFNKAEIDINLDSPIVEADIDRHIQFLKSLGVWGARMDAPAYYGKTTGGEHRHNDNSFRLARRMADKLSRVGLHITAQLDTDKDGIRYFPKSMGYEIPTIDFSYATNLIYAVIQQDPIVLADYIRKTLSLPTQPLRAPRNHDGILLRTPHLSEWHKEELLSFAYANNIQPLIHNGIVYELNCSLPHLLGVGMGTAEMQCRISLTMAVTIAVPGWCYLYAPYILGYKPEKFFQHDETEPRALNRQPVDSVHFETYLNSDVKAERYALIAYGQKIKLWLSTCNLLTDYSIDLLEDSVIWIHLRNHGLSFYANFSTVKTVKIPIGHGTFIALSAGLSGAMLAPLGYVFIEKVGV